MEVELNHRDYDGLIEAHNIINNNTQEYVELHGVTAKSAMHVTQSELNISLHRPSEVVCHTVQL